MNKYYLTIICALLGFALQCQVTPLEEIKESFQSYEYAVVIELCENLIEEGKDPEYYAKYLADSYRLNNDFERSAHWLEYLIEYQLAEQEDYLNIALVQKSLGNHEEALKLFMNYNSIYPNDPLVKRHLNNKEYAADLGVINESISIQNVQTANTKMNDFGAIEHRGKIIFSSSRKEGSSNKRRYKWDGENYLDLYSLSANGKEVMSFSNEINSSFHEGPVCFAPDGKTAYFTRNNYISGKKGKLEDGTINLKIYSAKKVDGKWSEIEEFNQNLEGFSTGHATISSDGKVMVFVSNSSDGNGGTDLYMATNGTYGWNKPINLGQSLNTELNEMFPFLHNDGSLYFSSDGHLGLGGLDVFKCSDFLKGNRIVEYMGAPINSEYDDFSFFLNKEKNKGFISSDRPGGAGGDDIYSFSISEEKNDLKLTAQVLSESSGIPLPSAKVELWANDQLLRTINLDNQGGFIGRFSHEECPLIVKVSNGDNWSSFEAEISHCRAEQEDIDLGQIHLLEQENSYHANVSVNQHGVKQVYQQSSTVNSMSSAHVSSMYSNPSQGNYSHSQAQYSDRRTDNTIQVVGNRQAYGENTPMGGLLITVTDKATGQTWETESPYSGDINLALNRNKTHEIVTEKNGCASASAEVNTNYSEDYIDIASAMNQKMIPLETDKTIVLENIFYDMGKWLLRRDATEELDKLVRTLLNNPSMVIELSSHTDCRGDAKENLKLSEKRAMAAVRYIIDNGVSPARISGKGFGESKLINRCSDGHNCSESEHQQNRRTEVTIISY